MQHHWPIPLFLSNLETKLRLPIFCCNFMSWNHCHKGYVMFSRDKKCTLRPCFSFQYLILKPQRHLKTLPDMKILISHYYYQQNGWLMVTSPVSFILQIRAWYDIGTVEICMGYIWNMKNTCTYQNYSLPFNFGKLAVKWLFL